MKKKKIFVVTIILFFIVFSSCKKKCIEPSLKTIKWEQDCGGQFNDLKIKTGFIIEDDFIIIHSKKEFDDKVTLKSNLCKANIDFDKYDLVIGTKSVPNGIRNVTYSLDDKCSEDEISLEISVKLQYITIPYTVTYYTLITKGTEKIKINIYVSY